MLEIIKLNETETIKKMFEVEKASNWVLSPKLDICIKSPP